MHGAFSPRGRNKIEANNFPAEEELMSKQDTVCLGEDDDESLAAYEELEPNPSVNRFFTFNTCKDSVMLLIGTIGAIVAGLLIPSISIIMGSIASSFGDPTVDASKMSEVIGATTKLVAIVAVSIFVFGYIFFAFWQHLAENLSLRLRSIYLHALLQ